MNRNQIIFKSYFSLGEDKPTIIDLNRHVIRQYAARWQKIGIALELKDYDIDIISLNNAYHPERTTKCFECVLAQWLKEISSPTWGKLDDAIKGKLSKVPNTIGSDLRGTIINA